ncbi:hypothetical protein GGS26DRAFT_591046 [Hypomontagnella submonticulosa]|nr:hypothetical protein GGS26DRAFT_591046 [Hypomontagnella submonticulosa]
MDEHGQVPGIDLGDNAFSNMPNDALAIDWTFGVQQDAVQDMWPITNSSPPQLMGEGHAKESGHKAYGCPCGANFSRFDALARHVKSKPDSLPQHPCMLCHGRQGASGFSRRDHLVQHLTGYHKVDGDIISTLIASIPMVAGTATDEGGSSAQQAQAPPSSGPVAGHINEFTNGYVGHASLLEPQSVMNPFDTQAYGTMPQPSNDVQFADNIQYSAGMELTNDMQFWGGGEFYPLDGAPQF